MRAMQLRATADVEDNPLILSELDVPRLLPGEILIQISACAVCRTDLHVVQGELKPPSLPLVPGHQIVGKVVGLADEVQRFRGGETVGAAWLASVCGVCDFCKNGRENLCPNSRYTGYHVPGGFAEFVAVKENFIYRLPENRAPETMAPLLCAGIVGYRAVKRAYVEPGKSVALFGFGSSAHLALQVLKNWGCPVFVVTRRASHRELALGLGADWAGSSAEEVPSPVDCAIVFAPSGEVAQRALRVLKRGGRCALAGVYMSKIPSLNYAEHLFHEKELVSVEANTREDGVQFLEAAFSMPLQTKISCFGLEEANQALLSLKQGRSQISPVLVI